MDRFGFPCGCAVFPKLPTNWVNAPTAFLLHLQLGFFFVPVVLEYVGPKWRTFVANMSIAIFFTFAACILPWIAWFVADWRMLCHVTSVPLALAILTPWFVPESARYVD